MSYRDVRLGRWRQADDGRSDEAGGVFSPVGPCLPYPPPFEEVVGAVLGGRMEGGELEAGTWLARLPPGGATDFLRTHYGEEPAADEAAADLRSATLAEAFAAARELDDDPEAAVFAQET